MSAFALRRAISDHIREGAHMNCRIVCLCSLLALSIIFHADVEAEPVQFQRVLESSEQPQTAVDQLLKDAVARCKREGLAALAEELAVTSTQWHVNDVLSLTFNCVAADDARLRQPGRDASAREARALPIARPQPLVNQPLFDWDMTYGAAFDLVGASRADTMRKYFKDTWYRAPYAERGALDPALFDGIDEKSVSVAVLMDMQTGFYGRGVSLLFVRGDEAEQRANEPRKRSIVTKPMNAATVRRMAELLMSFEPLPPEPHPYGEPGLEHFVHSGYSGVISIYLDGRTRQFPVHHKDMMDTDEATGKIKEGRLSRLLQNMERTPQQLQAQARKEARHSEVAPILKAARMGDVGEIHRLVAAGADLNVESDDKTPLLLAAEKQRAAAVAALLKLGADPNRLTRSRQAALTAAAYSGSLDIVRLLLDHGANPNIESETWTPLAAAISARMEDNLAVIRELVERGADVNKGAKSRHGIYREPPLITAISHSPALDVVKYLLSRGADVNVVHDGLTPLMHVSTLTPLTESHGEELLQILLDAGANVNHVTQNCRTALSFARHMGKEWVERRLLDVDAQPGIEQACKRSR